MERALPDQVRPVPLQLDPPRLGQRSSETSRFSRSISSSGMRAMENRPPWKILSRGTTRFFVYLLTNIYRP